MTAPRTFRKRPVQVEAMQYDGTRESGECLYRWSSGAVDWATVCHGEPWPTPALNVATLEGLMTVSPDDWVIRGVAGEFYPCKPGIFAATYTEVAPESDGARCVTVELPEPVRGVTKDDGYWLCREGIPYIAWKRDRYSDWAVSVRPEGSKPLEVNLAFEGEPFEPLSVDQARYLGLALLAACVEAEK